MTSRIPSLLLLTSLLAFGGCAAADAVGEWSGELDLTGSSGSPPSTIAGSYPVSAAVVAAAAEGQCGITLDVTGVGTWTKAGDIPCESGGFDVTLGDAENTALTIEEVGQARVAATSGNQLTLVLSGTAPDWSCTYEGSASHAL